MHFVIITTTTITTCHHHQQQPRTMPIVLPASTTTNDKLHAHQLSKYYGINGDTPGKQDSSQTTILSRQFDGTHSLFEVAVRLADGKELLSDPLMTIISNNSTTKMSNLAIRVIRKSVLPLMDIASTLTRTSANMVGQIAGGNYAHMRKEVSRKKMIKSSKVTENVGLVMVNEQNNLHTFKDKYKLLWQIFQIGKISRYITLIPLRNSTYHHYWLVRTSIPHS